MSTGDADGPEPKFCTRKVCSPMLVVSELNVMWANGQFAAFHVNMLLRCDRWTSIDRQTIIIEASKYPTQYASKLHNSQLYNNSDIHVSLIQNSR